MRSRSMSGDFGKGPIQAGHQVKEPKEVTLRSLFVAVTARCRALFAAKHAPDDSQADALGDQVTLPEAFLKAVSRFTKNDRQ